MNLDEYFARIGFQGSYEKPDLTLLKTLHRQHVMTIPFENLSIHCGEQITMDLEFVFKKIVRNHRGGWCCENNLLFGWVLQALGYKFVMLGARVFNNTKNEFGSRDSHLINKVVLDGKVYIADVSFGESWQIWEPLELVSDKDQIQRPGAFRLVEEGEVWTLEKIGRKPKYLNQEFDDSSMAEKKESKYIYCFSLTPRGVDHFFKTSHSLQTDPSSLFTIKSICSIQTATGFRALIGWTYSEVTFKPEEAVDLWDVKHVPDDDIEQVLWEKFHVKLKNKLFPTNKKACYTL